MSDIHRIEIDSNTKSSAETSFENKLKSLGYNTEIRLSNVYTIKHEFNKDQLRKIADSLHNQVVDTARINKERNIKFDYALELGFLPGVTDNVAHTTTDIINDLFKINLGLSKVFSSRLLFIKNHDLNQQDIENIAKELINILIERYHIKSYEKYQEDKGMDYITPIVKLEPSNQVLEINLEIEDEKLTELGKKGILDPKTNKTRGPLALSLNYLKTIREYYRKSKRKPSDIEIESIAQTWSEHCKHTIFASEIDDIKQGIYKTYIKGATEKIRKDLGKKDFCISVFKDNSGAIDFNKDFMVTDKAETHNSPSALDPYGGAITGIVGVNRDTIGFGMGALPIANKYGYCVGKPEDKKIIFRGKDKQNPSLPPRRILDGVVTGVKDGGNCSGIPTPTGFLFCDDHYKGKPLIFVGTIGLLPKKLPNGKPAHEKQAQPGDNIVMIGGRVGKDGIHGATFSSEEMDSGSPATAVQIGDPITQKKFSDAVVKEARDKLLYNSITDNGAGGLSCSVAEMAEECGGFILDLEKVPVKYPGIEPWEIWISESQERMTLSVPDDKLQEFQELMESRGVESTVLGRFNDSDRAIVNLNGKEIFNLDMNFLHHGLPKTKISTKPYPYEKEEPEINVDNIQELFQNLLGSHNICSYEYISLQYDHEVMHNSVIKPLQGKGRVNAPASVIKPLLDSKKGLAISQVLLPRLSRISCYDMAACAIDTAIRNTVAIGGNIDHMALMDNFCWCSSNDPKRLFQLKDASKGCYDYATQYKTPFISGKDSMFNDFKGFDENNNPIKISVHPTLMISTLSVIDDVKQTMSLDLKIPGDLIYIIGKTKDECGASEFYYHYDKTSGNPPKVDAKKARILYEKVHGLIKNQKISACASIERGGLAITLAKMSIAGQLGAEININEVPIEKELPTEKILFSESQSRFIITIDPKNKNQFENLLKEFDIAEIGKVNENNIFLIKNNDQEIINSKIENLTKIYKKKFKNY